LDIVGKRGWYFLLSALVIVPGIISLIIPPPLKAGIDFSSGSAFDVTFPSEVAVEDVRAALATAGHTNSRVQKIDFNEVFVRTSELEEGDRERIEGAFESAFGSRGTFSSIDTVSAEVAGDTVRNAIIAVVLSTIAILFFIWWAFRNVPGSYRYGVAAILAVVHDVLVILGIFSILGKVMDMEVNAMFVVGVLAVVGYSVNNTIVIFDRIRENVARDVNRLFAETVNISILESVGRTLGSSMTTLIALVAIMVFTGSALREFLLVFLIGLVAGTYSAIFIASQFLVLWERGELGRVLRLRRQRRVQAATTP
jgi:preprotein translocase subunit SecF